MELLEEMRMEGVLPNAQTFFGLLEYFGSKETVHKLFGITKQAGVGLDGFMYHVLSQAYDKHEMVDLAMEVC